jgi:hypothetical protein
MVAANPFWEPSGHAMVPALVLSAILSSHCHDQCGQRQGTCQSQCEGRDACLHHCNQQGLDCHRGCEPTVKALPAKDDKVVCGATANKKPKYCTKEEAEKLQKEQHAKIPQSARDRAERLRAQNEGSAVQ